MGELPIRVIDQPGGATLRCLCGTELATLRKGLVAGQALARTTGINRGQAQLAPDVTAAGLLVMIGHAMGCRQGNALLEAQQRAWSGL